MKKLKTFRVGLSDSMTFYDKIYYQLRIRQLMQKLNVV
jgi:hypothetical protein